MRRLCRAGRNYDDINDDWDSVAGIIEWWGNHQDVIAPISGPGHWNDPDMVLCGDFALSVYECRAQFALWAMWSAPLYLSVDLRQMDPAAKAVLVNAEVIAVNQDKLGKQGLRVATTGCDRNRMNCAQSVWVKTLANGDRAVALYNRESYGMPQAISAEWKALGLEAGSSWVVRDLWAGKDLGTVKDVFSAVINTHEAGIYRLRPASASEEVARE